MTDMSDVFKNRFVLLLLTVITMQNLHAARPEAVAGKFYSSNKEELSSQVKGLLHESENFSKESVSAIIVPHAGYVFSADTASVAYKTLHKKYKNIFLIGSSHHVNFDGASIYSEGNYKTPLGEVKVNQTIVSKLIESSSLITYSADAHSKEHTLEVQLPFLQTIYGDDLSIVPIIMATSNYETIQKVAQVLKPYFNDDNLFVISTDLSHYPSYEDAKRVDTLTLNGLTKNNSQEFIDAIIKNEKSLTSNLQTSACGWASLLTLLEFTKNQDYRYELLKYKNSGDSIYGDKEQVVGYSALRVYKQTDEFFLSEDEKKELLGLAKLSLYEATLKHQKVNIDKDRVSAKLHQNLGAFVTLYRDGNLRGCIGRFEPNQSLYSVVIDMAIAAAQNDTRFEVVKADELDKLDIEISVLTPRKKIASIGEIEIGKHGIYVQKGFQTGTYLPHVATQMNWNAEQFVSSCAKEKAGIEFKSYEELELSTYEAIVFKEKNINGEK